MEQDGRPFGVPHPRGEDRLVEILHARGLHWEWCCHPSALPAVATQSSRFPGMTFVLDHLGHNGGCDGDFETWAKDLAALNALDEQIEYIRRERLTRLEHDLAARKASHKAVSTEFDAACHRLRGLVDEQQTTTRKSLNRASRLTGDFITSELTARRGYSMKAPTSHYRPHNKRGFNKACGVKLTPVVPGGV